ncbi:MAG: Fur family transcriptional regulator [Candidatus Saccharimonadales bacterium]
MEEEIKSLLKQQGFSATKTRLAILRALLATQPATMQELITSLPQIDRATVYRTIDLFVDLNIAKKVSTGFKYRIELGESFQEHHHHLTCLRCSSVIDVHTPEIEYAIEQTAANNGFRPLRHDLEITGYCSNCS